MTLPQAKCEDGYCNINNDGRCVYCGNYPDFEHNPKIHSSATVSAIPPCLHANGWYRTIPGRFWGRRRVFVCTDCGEILEPEKKQESV